MRRAVVVIAAVLAAPAHADEIVHGSVVRVEHEEIYVNFGDKQGVGDGAALRIKRVIHLKHPVTRAAIKDWIPIGSATVTQAGNVLARAVLGTLVDRVRAGDVVEALVEEAAPEPSDAKPRPTEPPPLPVDPTTATVLGAFARQAGLSLDARIAAWERFLSTNKQSPYAAAIQQDLDALHALREQMKAPDASGGELVERLDHDAPAAALPGAAMPLAFVLALPERVASAYLHYRTVGQRTYTRKLLVREHDIYLRGAVPAEAVTPPGVEYFVEVTSPHGASGLAVGTPSSPIGVRVQAPPIASRFAEQRGRSTLTLDGEYLDFATFDRRDGDRRDTLYDARVDVAYRLDAWIQRVGVGYGVIGGLGGFADIAHDPAGSPIPKSGYHYGYADVEAGHPRWGALGMKLIAGVGKDGFGMGAEGRGRIGAWDRTNLTTTIRNIPDVGWHADVRFGASPVQSWLLGIVVGATNQPNGYDTAAKLGTEIQWIGHEHVSVLVRTSWQGRSSIHGGIGGGAALGFTW